MTPIKAIRAHCLGCSGTANEVKLCTVVTCPLFKYRLGKNPNIKKRELTDEQRAAIGERLNSAREKQ